VNQVINQSREFVQHIDETALDSLRTELLSKYKSFCSFVEFGSDELYESVVDDSVQEYKQQHILLIDSACLIFLHSTLDSMVDELLGVSVEYAKENWLKKSKTIRIELSLSDLMEDKENVVEKLLRKSINQCLHKSLPNKIDILFGIIKPEFPDSSTDYKYNRERIVRLDKLRTEYVHHKGKRMMSLGDIKNDLKYLQDTIQHIFQQFCLRFPDPTLLSNLDSINPK